MTRPSGGTTLRFVVLLLGAAVMVLPFAMMLATSFKGQSYVLSPSLVPDHPTLDNYVRAWTSNGFGRYFLNSAVVALSTVALVLLLGSMMAYAFARFEFAGKKVLFYVAGQLAFTTFLLRGFFAGIPRELDDAMLIDGANRWHIYRHLMLPLARPALATAAIFTFLGAWDEFVWAVTIIDSKDNRTLPMAIELFQGQHGTSWGLVFAASTIAVVPVIAVFVVFQRYFVSGLAAGALKG